MRPSIIARNKFKKPSEGWMEIFAYVFPFYIREPYRGRNSCSHSTLRLLANTSAYNFVQLRCFRKLLSERISFDVRLDKTQENPIFFPHYAVPYHSKPAFMAHFHNFFFLTFYFNYLNNHCIVIQVKTPSMNFLFSWNTVVCAINSRL